MIVCWAFFSYFKRDYSVSMYATESLVRKMTEFIAEFFSSILEGKYDHPEATDVWRSPIFLHKLSARKGVFRISASRVYSVVRVL